MNALLKFCLCAALLVVVSEGIPTLATSSQQPASGVATVTISVAGRSSTAPQLAVGDVTVRVDGKIRPVISCERAGSNEPVDLIILIDNALARNRENRWDELQTFLKDQAADTRETIAYADGKVVKISQAATLDHVLAANAVMNPAAKSAPAYAMYEAVQNLIDMWPAGTGRRVLIFVTRGFPRDYASTGIRPENSLPLRRLIDAAQRNGVVVYTIQSSSTLTGDPNSLTLLATETGGKGFATGMEPGPSLQKFLQEIQNYIEQQYSIKFSVVPAAKPHFDSLRVATNAKAVELRCPSRVFIPAK